MRNGTAIPNEEFEALLQLIADTFSLEFLQKQSGHPLQKLWGRSDTLASNELISLAIAIKNLSLIDPIWIREQVKLAKSSTINTYRGALFEILSLNILHGQEHPVQPAKMNQAGYDGVIRNGQQNIRVSIKNYGKSSFQKQFEQKARLLESTIIGLLKKYAFPPSQILLDFPSDFPEERDWKMLDERIDAIFKEQRTSEEPFAALVEPIDPALPVSRENGRLIFTLFIHPIKSDIDKFHPKFNSYTLMISAAYHKNEDRNLFSKMQDACANLSKHAAIEDDENRNALFLHMPETISVSKCEEWLESYFKAYPSKPITLVILYQPTVALDLAINSTDINHCVKFFDRGLGKIRGHLLFEIPIGRISPESSDLMYLATYPDGSTETIILSDRYIYQHGEHYIKMEPDGKGGYAGNIKKLGDGIFSNIIVELPGQPMAIIKGKFPPSDELLIL